MLRAKRALGIAIAGVSVAAMLLLVMGASAPAGRAQVDPASRALQYLQGQQRSDGNSSRSASRSPDCP